MEQLQRPSVLLKGLEKKKIEVFIDTCRPKEQDLLFHTSQTLGLESNGTSL